jgi:hypothetical protein
MRLLLRVCHAPFDRLRTNHPSPFGLPPHVVIESLTPTPSHIPCAHSTSLPPPFSLRPGIGGGGGGGSAGGGDSTTGTRKVARAHRRSIAARRVPSNAPRKSSWKAGLCLLRGALPGFGTFGQRMARHSNFASPSTHPRQTAKCQAARAWVGRTGRIRSVLHFRTVRPRHVGRAARPRVSLPYCSSRGVRRRRIEWSRALVFGLWISALGGIASSRLRSAGLLTVSDRQKASPDRIETDGCSL